MYAPKTVVQAMLNLLAADTATLGLLVANKVKLVADAFVFDPLMVPGDFTLATFTGSTPLEPDAGTQEVGYDPDTGLWFIQLIPPIGGWYWECTAAPATPEVIYGAIVTNAAGALLFGAQPKETPTTIQDVGDSVAFPWLRYYIDPQPFQ